MVCGVWALARLAVGRAPRPDFETRRVLLPRPIRRASILSPARLTLPLERSWVWAVVVNEAPGPGRVVCGRGGGGPRPPRPSARLARPKHPIPKNMWCSLHATSSNNKQTPRRPGAQCCQPKRGKGMDDTGARAREGMRKGGKEEISKKKTSNNKQTSNKQKLVHQKVLPEYLKIT